MLLVEVVGRLVEQQNVRLFEKQLRKQDLRPLTARKLADILVKTERVQFERVPDLIDLRIDCIEIMLFKHLLQHAHFLKKGVHRILVCVTHAFADPVHLLFLLVEPGKCGRQHVADRHAGL